ncbi:hypothetical protein NC653_009261 [Populus alba x Populus x berolinensis]|uniref:Uncharacterized protein n=1 Tax=Populus alba x Populus x berolinensis TaxID=444605 RepID=A0AAD6R9P7_9ROSI|nr:hypothetical protein NC653_009261 [Populus alba x Populus x berolinensis]
MALPSLARSSPNSLSAKTNNP